MVLWQKEAEKLQSLQGGQHCIQFPVAVNGFMPVVRTALDVAVVDFVSKLSHLA